MRRGRDERVSVCLVGLVAEGHSGVPRYASALTRALDAVSHEFPDLSLSLLTTERAAAEIAPDTLDVRTLRFGRAVRAGPTRTMLEQFSVAKHRADLLHFFDLTGPMVAPGRPFITTIHDAASVHGFTHASKFQFFRRVYKRRLHPWAVQRSRAAIAVSQFAKDEAVRHFDADPSRVFVVHSGPGLTNVDQSSGAAVRMPASSYVLFVGNLAANKNLPFLVRAFEQAEVPARLLFVGRPGYQYSALRAAIEASPARQRIDVLLDASDADVERLYRSASALVLPSRYEGFGFTALEAMMRGCPVLASDIPGIREISGTAAALLPTDDADAWADAIRRVVNDESFRAELKAKGLRRALRYDWEESARRVCEVFASVGASMHEQR